MTKKDKIMLTAATAFLAFTTTAVIAAPAGKSTQTIEKCYGIVKAGMNDCATATASCASSATKDNQADAFILLPKGTCTRIVGGMLKPEKAT